MKSRLRSLVLVSLLFVLGCKATQEQTTVPRFPYPDGGLVDVYRRPMPDSSIVDAPAKQDAPNADISISNNDGAASKDGTSGETGPACPGSCDDNNPCTSDSCDEKARTCVNRPMDENSTCASPCLAGGRGVCKSGLCSGSAANDGIACEDGNPCTVNDTCKGGLCYSGSEKVCPPINNCHENGTCDIRNGACVEVKTLDGKACDDGLMCTSGDRCTNGLCVGVAFACSSGSSCSQGTGVCKIGDKPAFPSGTLATAWPKVKFTGAGNLALDPQQNLYAVGSISESADLGAGPIVKASKGNDLLVAKINPDTGKAVWSTIFGDDLNQSGTAIAANGKGQVAVCGIFGGTMKFGNSEIASPGAAASNPDAFVAAVDATTGAGLWAVRPMIIGKALAVAVDPISGDFVVCGTAAGRAATGLVATSSAADDGDIVVARLAASTGAVVWGRQLGAPAIQTCERVAFDSAGHLFLAGTMSSLRSGGGDAGASGALDFGTGVSLPLPTVVPNGAASVVWVANLDVTDGKAVTAVGFGEKGTHVLHSLTCDGQGNVLVSGGFRTRMVLGAADLSSGANQNAFLAKLDGKLIPQWAKSWSGGGLTAVTQVAAEPAGSVVMVGNYTVSVILDDIPVALGTTGLSGFIARVDAKSGKVTSARGYGAPDVNQDSVGLQVVASGAAAGAIWYAGGFTGSLQLGPPAAALVSTETGSTVASFIGRLAP